VTERPERLVVSDYDRTREPSGSTELRWNVRVGSLVDSEEVLGEAYLWSGYDMAIESPCTGFVTHLATEARFGEPLVRIAPLAPDDPRVIARARARQHVAEATDHARRIRDRPAPSVSQLSRAAACRVALRPLVERCAAHPDPVLSESTELASRFAFAAPNSEGPRQRAHRVARHLGFAQVA
jgi:hypothetical protein